MKQIFKNKNALLAVLIVGIIAMTVAFAAVSSQLNIFGTATIREGSYKIVIDDWARDNSQLSLVSGQTNTSYEITPASITSNTMTIENLKVGFKQPGDAIKYTFNIENQGTIDATLNSFNIEPLVCKRNNETVSCPSITQEVKCGNPLTTPTVGTDLLAGQTIPCTYLIGYNEITEEGNNYSIEGVELEAEISFTYGQREMTVYRVTFRGEGNSLGDIVGEEGEEIDLPELTKNGYTFEGWTDVENSNEAKYSKNNKYTVNSDKELYPVFIKERYAITYSLDGGSASNPDGYYLDSEDITLNNPSKTGYTFTGWSGTGLTGNNNMEVTISTGSTGNRSYEAHYTPITYTLTYNLNNGNTTNPNSYNIESESIILVNPTKTVTVVPNANNTGATIGSNSSAEQTFGGWSGTDLTGLNNQIVTIVTGSTGNRSYTANWVSVGITLPSISKPGYDCKWYDSNNTLMGGSLEPWSPESTSETTVNAYASCSVSTYAITLNKQSGSGGTNTIYETYNTKYSLTNNGNAMTTSANPITKPTRDGYTFKGYYTGTNGSGTQYINENGYLTSSASKTNFTNSGTLYAYWKQSIICKKATTLYTATCSYTSGSDYCYGDGYKSGSTKGTKITYGHTTLTDGKMTSGYALDCKVTKSGGYTHRFYYVSDYYDTVNDTFDTNTATLVYYSNVSSGSASTSNYQYYSSKANYRGPVTAAAQLPTTSQWDNISLKEINRQILSNNGGASHTTTTSNGSTNLPLFSYSGKAARLLSLHEINQACPNACSIVGSIKNCNYLLQGTKYEDSSKSSAGVWIEDVSSVTSKADVLRSQARNVYPWETTATYYGVRPAIDVPYSAIQLQ